MVRKKVNKLPMRSMQKETMTGSSLQTEGLYSVEVEEVTAIGTEVIVATMMMMMPRTMVKMKLQILTAAMMRRSMTMTS